MCSAQSAPPLSLQQTPTANLQAQLNSFPMRWAEMSRPSLSSKVGAGMTPAGATVARAGARANEALLVQRQQIVEELTRRDTLQSEQDRIAQERQQVIDQQMKERQKLTEQMLAQQQKARADADEVQRQSIARLTQARNAQQQEILRMQASQAAEIKSRQELQAAEIAKQRLASDAAASSLRALGTRRPTTSAPTATESKRRGRKMGNRAGRPANDLRIGSSNVATGAGVNIGG